MMRDESFHEFSESLQELLRCPVCLGSLYPTTSFCVNGHGTCTSCKAKLNSCPICKMEFAVHKATLFNQVMERLPLPCLFKDEGCPVLMSFKDKSHKEFCEYRPVQCKVNDCSWRGMIKHLLLHVRAFHDNELYDIPRGRTVCNGNYNIPNKQENSSSWSLVLFEDNLFWKHYKRDGEDKLITHKFYHMPMVKPEMQYYFVVSFKSGHIEFAGTCKAKVITESDDGAENCDDSVMKIPNHQLLKFRDVYSSNKHEYRYFMRIVDADEKS